METKNHNPYKRIKRDGKQKYEHRIVMEKFLGRLLTFNEIVHHLDGNKRNNELKNLELIGRGVHAGNHTRERAKYVEIICAECWKKFKMREKWYEFRRLRQKNFYCSHLCRGLGVSTNQYKDISKTYNVNVVKGLSMGWTGYKIAQENNMNRATVYNHIRRIRNKMTQ